MQKGGLIMHQQHSNDLDFLEKLNDTDRQIFNNKTQKEKEKAITENRLAKAEEKLDKEGLELGQLTDRIATKSFQG